MEEEEEDPWNARIARTGCAAENEAVLLCYADTRDWRRCADAVRTFRACFERHQRNVAAAAGAAPGAAPAPNGAAAQGTPTPTPAAAQ